MRPSNIHVGSGGGSRRRAAVSMLKALTLAGSDCQSWMPPSSTSICLYEVLKKQNKPMHFKELASIVKGTSEKHSGLSVMTIHNYLVEDNRFMNFDRGTYALTEWNIKRHKTYTEMIYKLLIDRKKAMNIYQIFGELHNRDYNKIENIKAALLQNPKVFVKIGHTLYDLVERHPKQEKYGDENSEIRLLIQKDKKIYLD